MSLIRDYYFRFQVLVHEVAKFGVVGLAGFVVQLGVQNLLHSGLKVGAITSLTVAYVIAAAVTFLGNRHWAFKHRKGAGLKRETIVFVLLNLVGYGIQVGIVDVAYYGLGYKSGLAYNIATVIGPTPPGTGVSQPATPRASLNATSPTTLVRPSAA